MTGSESANIGAKVFGRRIPLFRVLRQHSGDDTFEVGRNGRVYFRRARWCFLYVLVCNRHRGFATKGRLTCDHLKEDHAERVKIAARVDLLTLSLFRRKITGGTHDRTGLGELVVGAAESASDTKVGHFDLIIASNHDVAGFHVAVDGPVSVSEPESASHIGDNIGGPAKLKRTFIGQQLGETLTLNVLHNNEVGVVLVTPVVDGDNARMV